MTTSALRRLGSAARITSRAALACGTLLAAACGATGPEVGKADDPGFLAVVLSTPRTDDGAIQFSLSGSGIDSLASPGRDLFWARLDDPRHRVIVAGDLRDGQIARFWVPDRRLVSAYRGEVEQVAARSTYTQRSPLDYAISVRMAAGGK